jgi:type IV secretory pathway VirB4 component
MIKSAIQRVKAYKKQRDDRPKEYHLEFGDQDPTDIISYSGLKEHSDRLEIGNRHVRTLFVSGYPFHAENDLINALNNFAYTADIKQRIEVVDTNEALKLIKDKITILESRRLNKLRNHSVVGPDIEEPLVSAKQMQTKIRRGEEKLVQLSITITLHAKSPDELEEVTQMLLSTMSAYLFFVKPATYQQLEGLQTILPRGENSLNQRRNLTTTAAGLMFPFMSSELVHNTGIMYGINNKSRSLVIIDRYKLTNANSIIFAQSGSGKSYTSKVEILRQLSKGTRVIVIDPEREYQHLAESVNGEYIRLSAQSKQKINPFDPGTTARDKKSLAEHIQDLTKVIMLMVGGEVTAQELAGIDKAIVSIYEKSGKKTPVLADFYEQLHKQGHHKLCERLERYTTGSLTDILDSPTNIELNNRLVVFDIKDLPDTLRQIMMMIVANFVQNEVKANPERRMLVIDEGWLLLQHEESAQFVSDLVRRARKYYLGVTIISQHVNDFLGNKYGEVIAAQSAMRILLHQDSTTIKKVVETFGLSQEEQKYLTGAKRGEALIIADEDHVSLDIKAAEKEHPLITTDPTERKTA